MLKTVPELLSELGAAIRDRRIAQGLSQEVAASRAGIGLRTLRRLERDGQATTATLANVAIVLRCEQGLEGLFPLPPASSLDELLKRQAQAAPVRRQRAPRRPRP